MDVTITYYIRDKVNSGYIEEGNINNNEIVGLNYYDNIDGYIKSEYRMDKFSKENNLTEDFKRIRREI